MPRPFVPHKSGVHRAACFALFRALLRQRRGLPNTLSFTGYSSRIRWLFERSRKLTGHAKVTEALTLGYKTLEVLSDPSLVPKVLAGLSSIPKYKARPEPVKKASTKAPEPHVSSILRRPHQNVSGRRHVPTLVNACRFPFLRIKKPQPARLSALIRASVNTREARLLAMTKLQKLLDIGKWEDEWDRTMADHFPEIPSDDESWVTAPKNALQDVHEYYERALVKRMDYAVKMTDILEKEKVLAREEAIRRGSEMSSGNDFEYQQPDVHEAREPSRTSAPTAATLSIGFM